MNRNYILIGIFIIFNALSALGAHIVGGDVTYRCIASYPVNRVSRFEVKFTIYRDSKSGGAFFDIPGRFGIYSKNINGNVWTHQQTLDVGPIQIENVPLNDECVIVPPNIGVEKTSYIFEVDLEWGENVYQIAYQRCCRNGTISNLINPGETGAVFYVEMYPEAINTCNSSPVFLNFPPILICANKPLNFDHSALDNEGDNIIYEFCAPLTSGGTDGATTPGDPNSCTGVIPLPSLCLPPFQEVNFIQPAYSGSKPLGGSPIITIHPNTGLITGTPTTLGQYAVGVCAKEYRNGKLLSVVRRDFQFNVTICQGPSEEINRSLCEGDSIAINGTYFSSPGTYVQNFQTSTGCDSTLIITIENQPTKEANLSLKKCRLETLTINGQSYVNAGNYDQQLTSASGCDSILHIDISLHPPVKSVLDVNKCASESLTLNGQVFALGGTYEQQLTTAVGCDSLLTIHITDLPNTSSSLSYALCDDEVVSVNGQDYNITGKYEQHLTNSYGCDSTIFIDVTKHFSSEKILTFSLCNDNTIVVNNESYTVAGQYIQHFVNATGCDSSLIINVQDCEKLIHYDMETCDAQNTENSMIYTEFTPFYGSLPECGKVTATNIFRDQPVFNKHSCTPGYLDGIAMCISSLKTCNPNNSTVEALKFEVTLSPDDDFGIRLNQIEFYQKAPGNFNWIGGSTGLNDYPQKFSIKIYKDGVEVYRKQDIKTTPDWKLENFDFTADDVFATKITSTFTIEILPYCTVGNGATVSVWDIDELSVFVSCDNEENRQVKGSIVNKSIHQSSTTITRFDGNVSSSVPVAEDGNFVFKNTKADKAYTFKGYDNSNVTLGLQTSDLVKLQRHILGIEKFDNVLQYLAADVNNDQKITVSDLVQLRKVMLGLTAGFKTNTSWRFFDLTQSKMENNPWKINDFMVVKPSGVNVDYMDFIAVKIGDVDGSSWLKKQVLTTGKL